MLNFESCGLEICGKRPEQRNRMSAVTTTQEGSMYISKLSLYFKLDLMVYFSIIWGIVMDGQFSLIFIRYHSFQSCTDEGTK